MEQIKLLQDNVALRRLYAWLSSQHFIDTCIDLIYNEDTQNLEDALFIMNSFPFPIQTLINNIVGEVCARVNDNYEAEELGISLVPEVEWLLVSSVAGKHKAAIFFYKKLDAMSISEANRKKLAVGITIETLGKIVAEGLPLHSWILEYALQDDTIRHCWATNARLKWLIANKVQLTEQLCYSIANTGKYIAVKYVLDSGVSFDLQKAVALAAGAHYHLYLAKADGSPYRIDESLASLTELLMSLANDIPRDATIKSSDEQR